MNPLVNKSEMRRLGWQPALIAELLGSPDKIESHKRGFKRWVEHLYLRDRIEAGMRTPQFQALEQKRRQRRKNSQQRMEALPARYHSWEKALPDAAAGLFTLNRYAKYKQCSERNKHEIYELKNEFLRLLYAHGFCTAAWLHRLTLAARQCRECGGSGEGCGACGGSGIFREGRILSFWCFRFEIDGKFYCWHQPLDLVAFAPVETVPPRDWEGLPPSEKPLHLAPRKFVQIKELLRWVISRGADPLPAETRTAVEELKKDPNQHTFHFEEAC